jgi:hypothetical protein
MRKRPHSAKIRIDQNGGSCDDRPASAVEQGRDWLRAQNLTRFERQEPVGGVGLRPATESESKLLPTDSLNALCKRDLITLLRRQPCRFDDVDLAILSASTIQRLKVLRARAREGKSVEEAAEFAHWLTASGLVKLCAGQDKGEVHRLAQDTLFDCDSYWRNQGQGPWIAKSELEAVNAKLDNLMALVASRAPGDLAQPALAVMEGGAAS